MHRRTCIRSATALAALAVTAPVAVSSAIAAAGVGPAITSFTPTKVKPAAKVTIAGKNFKGATAVMVGGARMKFTVVSPTKIVVTLSRKAKGGTITVETAHGSGSSHQALKVT